MNLKAWLNRPVLPYGLGLFRILFGIIILWDLKRFYDIKIVDSFYERGIIFHYDFLHLPLPEEGVMKLLMATLVVSAIFITLGVLYRWAMLVFAIGFSYFFFLDQTLYNNHLYMLSMLSFMMVFIPADAAFSLNGKRKRVTIPQWSYRLPQFLVVVVYFFGGIVKLNPYWFDFHPVEEAINAAASRTGTEFLRADWVKYLFTYGGIFFDLLIGPLLWIRKTRTVAIILAVLFNLTNSYVFNDIFIFPFFMICALILFVDQEKLADRLKKINLLSKKEVTQVGKPLGNLGFIVIICFVLYQLVMPFRHFFKDGYTDWTGELQRFSWRMKIQNREINELEFAILDVENQQIHDIQVAKHLFPDEIVQMCNSPRMIIQFAEYLKEEVAAKNGVTNCWVRCKINVSFNGLPSCLIFDPKANLLEEYAKHESFNDWINPLPKKGDPAVPVSNTKISEDIMKNGI